MEFYKATKKGTGAGCNWQFDSKVGGNYCVFLNWVKQSGWNPKGNGGKGTGIFQGQKGVIKFSTTEIGAMLQCMNLKVSLKSINEGAPFFHQSPDRTTIIDFIKFKEANWKKDQAGNPLPDKMGYTLSILVKDKKDSSQNTNVTLAFNLAEAAKLKVWFENALWHIFDGQYAEEKKKFKESQAKKNSGENIDL